jgi:hypothetical protein
MIGKLLSEVARRAKRSRLRPSQNLCDMKEKRIKQILQFGFAAICLCGVRPVFADSGLPVIDISQVVFGQMFEGNANDLVRFELQRSGDTNAGPFDVTISYGGTATTNVDFTTVATVTFDSGEVTKTFDLQPLNDTDVEGRETIVLTISPGDGYLVGTNTLTAGATAFIVDDDTPAETVLFQESFDADVSADWTLTVGSLNPDSQDFSAVFGFDYGQPGFDIPPAPHSNGDTLGLLLSVNKLDALGEAAGVNAYLNGQDFSGNYAIRFDMYLMQNLASTEYAMFGLNHDATHTNWFSFDSGVPNGWNFDGIFAAVASDTLTNGDYSLFSNPWAAANPGPTLLAQRAASTLQDEFHQPPWSSTSGPGLPSNIPGTPTPSWAEVELRQVNGVVTLSINNTNILTYRNGTSFQHGTIMLGYNDPSDSIGTGGGGLVIYDNLRVVSVSETGPADVHISSISRAGNNVQIDFTAGTTDLASGFKLVSADSVTGPYSIDNGATIISTGPGSFRATTVSTDNLKFFQISRTP